MSSLQHRNSIICYEMFPQGALQGRGRTARQLVFTIKSTDYLKTFLMNSGEAPNKRAQETNHNEAKTTSVEMSDG